MNYTIMEENSVKVELGFFKRLKISITKVEEYFLVAAEGTKRSIIYLIKLMLIFTFILSGTLIIMLNYHIKNLGNYIENNIPNFEISEGKFHIDSEKEITIETNTTSKTKIIMDNGTNIDKFFEQIDSKKQDSVILLEDKIYINTEFSGLISYSYNDIQEELGIEVLSKDSIVSILKSNQLILVIGMYITFGIFAIFLIRNLIDALLVSLIGRLGAIVTGIPLKYSALYSMAISATTLSIILTLIYSIIYILTGFTIKNFDVLYTIIAYIYMITAIVLLRANYIKPKHNIEKLKDRKEMENSNE